MKENKLIDVCEKIELLLNNGKMENQVSQPVWGNWGNNGWWSSPSSVGKWVEENPKFNLFLQYYGIEEEFIEICKDGLYYGDLYNKFIDKPEILTKMFLFLNNIKDYYNRTPLFWACRKNNLEMVKILLENGDKESINVKDNYNNTPLSWACRKNNLEMVKLLLENGDKESINKPNNDGKTPLIWACRENNLEMIKILLENGTQESINKPDKNEWTPLFWAKYHSNKEMVELLGNGGEKMENIQVTQPEWDNKGYWSSSSSAKEWAEENPKFNLFLKYYGIKKEFIEICKYGLNYSDLYDKFKNKPEILTKMFVFLNNITNDYNQTPLFWACWKNNLEMVKLLLENGAKESINVKDKYNRTLLFWTCNKNNLEMAKLLLENGAKESVNIKDKNSQTPLHWACGENNLEMVKILLENGAQESVNEPDKYDKTPLYWACWNKNNLEMIKILLENGAQESVNDIRGLLDSFKDKSKIAELFKNDKKDINFKNDINWNGIDTPAIIREVCDEIANFLIDKNRKYGNSALNPLRIFSKSDPFEQLKVRIDDKLSRLFNMQKDDNEDVFEDLRGYLILYKVLEKIHKKNNYSENKDRDKNERR